MVSEVEMGLGFCLPLL